MTSPKSATTAQGPFSRAAVRSLLQIHDEALARTKDSGLSESARKNSHETVALCVIRADMEGTTIAALRKAVPHD